MLTKLVELVKSFDPSVNNESEQIYSNNFLKLFQECMVKYSKEIYIEFHGDGAYFGKQILISFNGYYHMHNDPIELNFEMAYDFSTEQYVIYKANHNGYWVPSFSSGKMTKEFQNILRKTLLNAFGIPKKEI